MQLSYVLYLALCGAATASPKKSHTYPSSLVFPTTTVAIVGTGTGTGIFPTGTGHATGTASSVAPTYTAYEVLELPCKHGAKLTCCDLKFSNEDTESGCQCSHLLSDDQS